MAMDDATNLVSELLGKLSELEQKVEHHRQDMALEFQRYSQNLLQSVSGDVSAKVEKAIKDSICNYPALRPALDSDNPIRNESPKSHMDNDGDTKAASDNSRRRRGKERSPPPLLPHTSGTPPPDEAAPRSPHEREREFQGLFTPSYLPLLDGRDSSKSSPSPAPALPTALLLSPDQTEELTKDSAKVEQPASPLATTPRPDAVRRPTEDTISSSTSDDSTGKHPRRSALRRSSSSSIKVQSPRRVRFEVEGGEVFPTVSPPLSPRITEHTQSPLANATNLMNSSYNSGSTGRGAEDEEAGELLGSSPPLPKKVTSTDRLKALARNSTEDTSKWAMVGNLQDMDEAEEMLVMGGRKRPNSSTPAMSTNTDAPGNNTSMVESSRAVAEHVEDVKAAEEPVDAYEDENDDLLEMPALTSFKTKKRFSPPRPGVSSEGSPKATQSTLALKKSTQEAPSRAPQSTQNDVVPTAFDEDDELFDWDPDEGDEDGAKRNKGTRDSKTPLKYIQEVDDEEVEDADATASDAQEPEISSRFSTSPGIPITRNVPPPASLPSRHVKEAVGSYNGRPFTISSVKDHSILEKAAKMGNLYSFVGSVDGRSGVDESSSYRPDLATFTGTPKSFSQRLMMEEFEEARRQSPTNGIP